MQPQRTILLAALAAFGCAPVTSSSSNPPALPDEDPRLAADPAAESTPSGVRAEPSVTPTIDRVAIDTEVRGRLADIRACYDTRAAADPELRGVVVARFEIDDAGVARRIELSSEDLEDSELDGCLRGILQSIEFPRAPERELVAVTYPFDFRPQ